MGRQTITPNASPNKKQTAYLKSSLHFIKTSIFDSKLSFTPVKEKSIKLK